MASTPVAGSTPPDSTVACVYALERGPPPLLTQDPLGLVGRDRHEPGAKGGLVADTADLLPGDQPRRLGGLLRDGMVTCDVRGHAAHVVMVIDDDAAEGEFVTGGSSRQQASPPPVSRSCHRFHVL